jgi:hypothetical protein
LWNGAKATTDCTYNKTTCDPGYEKAVGNVKVEDSTIKAQLYLSGCPYVYDSGWQAGTQVNFTAYLVSATSKATSGGVSLVFNLANGDSECNSGNWTN